MGQFNKKQTLYNMKSILRLLILLSTKNINCYGQTRIKDIASFEGVRENFLVGQGLSFV